MATKKTNKSKNTTKNKKSSSKTSSTVKNKQKSAVDENTKRVHDEIAAIIMLVTGIFLAIAMHTDFAGMLGEAVSTFLKGIFGLGSFVLPYFLIIFSAMMFAKMNKPFKGRTVILILIIFIMVDILNAGRFLEDFNTAEETLSNVYHKGVLLRNGGVAGMYIGNLVAKMVGISGVYLFSFAVIIICVLLTVNTPISRAYEKAKERKAIRKERKAKREEIEELPAKQIEDINQEQRDFLSYINAVPKKKNGAKSGKNKKNIMDILKNDDKFGLKNSVDSVDDMADTAVDKEEKSAKDKLNEEKTAQDTAQMLFKSLENSGKGDYILPPLNLLKINKNKKVNKKDNENLSENAKLLEETLKSFNVEAKVINVTKGSSVTRYEIQPAIGVKVASIVRLADDIALNLRAKSIRIEAPIPGKAAVGIEVENNTRETVTVGEIISSQEFRQNPSKLAFAVGKDISGKAVVADLAKMPHMLIAGATGSGKSVCINTIIASILYRSTPDEVKMLLIDPKMVELGNYNGIPHLLIPVVTDSTKAAAALNWAVAEMTNRYKKFAENKVRDIKAYNALMKKEEQDQEVMPQIVIIIDELADLMMVASSQVEEAICRLAQLARAAGMHLIVATQRPSVDVVTGLIKANIPSRIAFMVSSQIDSRTIIDMPGAEKLVGNGDMLYKPQDMDKPLRIQGPFISDDEVRNIITYVKSQKEETEYDASITESIEKGNVNNGTEEKDELTDDAIQTVIKAGQASVSMLQRRFRIGYNRAARIIEDMQDMGVIGPQDGARPRTVLWTQEDYEKKEKESEQV